jgi:hypothetical protein
MGTRFVTSVIYIGNRMHADGDLLCQRFRFLKPDKGISKIRLAAKAPRPALLQLVVLLRCTLDLTGQGGPVQSRVRVHGCEIGSAGRPIALTGNIWDGKVVGRIMH